MQGWAEATAMHGKGDEWETASNGRMERARRSKRRRKDVMATAVPFLGWEGRLTRLPSPWARDSPPRRREEPHVESPLYFHHGLVSVRKSVSVHGVRVTMSSGISEWAS